MHGKTCRTRKVLLLATALIVAGGGGSVSAATASNAQAAAVPDPSPALATAQLQATLAGSLELAEATPGAPASTLPAMTLDDDPAMVPIDAQGYFQVADIADGDHSLYLHFPSGSEAEIPFRMLEGRGLDLGTVSVRDGLIAGHTGFDGYHFGFVDENGDGLNDNCLDANGDGICDQGGRYAGYPYMMGQGFAMPTMTASTTTSVMQTATA